MDLHRWWATNPEERYWLEVTDRADLGVDLNAPQLRDDGQEYYGYSLIREVQDGDGIFHYHKDQKAIVAWSRATGAVWEDSVVWGAHGTVARNAGVTPYVRPGWRLGLAGTQPLDPIVTLSDLRSLQDRIQAVRDALEQKYGKPVYFPFEPPEKRDMRPTQAYLAKLPAEVVNLIPALASSVRLVHTSAGVPAQGTIESNHEPSSHLGAPYRAADEEVAISERDPFSVDPALVERANRGHAMTQNRLATYLSTHGLEPRSPTPDEPNYDLAWSQDATTYVAEVKSLTNANEEKQLRLGLGQLLHYRFLLRQQYGDVRAILMIERAPTASSWVHLCNEVGVVLVWPETLESKLPLPSLEHVRVQAYGC